ncbi:hypothetical protein H0E87_007581 [Populus deltoides]|uniref:Uncharacterized protein n=1 Tax=Populus deltoides TaxID=3696 RepID=A0A8T2ZD44_POPDE|nr:hypothetical protein H0E87_007581 [Populus deltoides]
MESCCIHKKHHHGCLSGMMVILANSKVSICSLNNVQAQHFSDSVKSHKNGASLGIKLSTTVSRSMAEDEIQHCQAQKDKIKYCSVLCAFSMPATDAHVSVYQRGTSVLLWISTALLDAIAVHGFRNSDTISISFSHEPSSDTSTFSRLVHPTGSPSESTVFLSENLLQQLLLIILMKLIVMGG